MVYIGIDIAKFKHFASVVSSDGEVIIKPFPFENSRQGFMKLIEEIENFAKFSLPMQQLFSKKCCLHLVLYFCFYYFIIYFSFRQLGY